MWKRLAIGSAIDSFTLPWQTLSLSLLALVLYLVAGPAPEVLVYDRDAISTGEWWRLITGQVVHSDAEHALWDIAALALFGALFEGRLGRHFVLSLALGTLAIDAWLWWAMPELIRYCGLSGVINVLIAAGLWRLWRGTRDPLVLWIGLAAVAKIGLEMATGGALLTDMVWPSVPEIHAVGFTAGLLAAQLCGSAVTAAPSGLPASYARAEVPRTSDAPVLHRSAQRTLPKNRRLS